MKISTGFMHSPFHEIRRHSRTAPTGEADNLSSLFTIGRAPVIA
jgi:hypothetical protein